MNERLTSDDLCYVFEHQVIPRYIESQRGRGSTSAPLRFVSVGGQPGAGKGGVLIAVERGLPGAVIVNGDELRRFHPDYERLMAEEPLRMPEVTAAAAGQWVGWANEYLRQHQVSAIVETTLRDAAMLRKEFTTFKAAGYETELRVVAVPLELSRAGIVSRYIQQVKAFGAGRWTASAAHDLAASNVRETVRTLVTSGVVDHVVVQNRYGQVFYNAPIGSEKLNHAEAAVQAVDQARNIQSLTTEQAQSWFASTREAIEERFGEQDADLLTVMHRLATTDAALVAEQAYPGDTQAQHRACERLARAVETIRITSLE